MAQGFDDTRPDERVIEVAAAGSVVESVGAIGAVVLAILSLAGVLPTFLLAIATIAAGAALLFEGLAIAARWSRIYKLALPKDAAGAELGGGVGAESLGGVGAITLGILALVGISPMSLLEVALIVLGAGLMIGTGAFSRITDVEAPVRDPKMRVLLDDAFMASSGTHSFVGIGAVVLGILALLGQAPLVLTTVGVLCVGAAVLLGGSTLAGRFFGRLRGAL